MTAEEESRIARVLRVVEAGRRARGRVLSEEDVARGIAEATGLSPAGVRLAFEEHLEVSPEPGEVERLVARAGRAPGCHVTLSAHVPTAALRALALALATAPRVFLRPSRRDPWLANELARLLRNDAELAAAGGEVRVVETVQASAGDEVHAYGGAEALRAIGASLPEGARLVPHGPGLGLALVGEGNLDEAARALGRDVVPFDQRGCLSPRFALVVGDEARALDFARALARALEAWEARVPRGALFPEEAEGLAAYRATMRAIGTYLEGPGFALGVDPSPRSLLELLPPPGRVLHLAPLSSARPDEDLERLLSPLSELVTTVGHEGAGSLLPSLPRLAPGARIALLGAMQRPPLDGPVDLRNALPTPRGPASTSGE